MALSIEVQPRDGGWVKLGTQQDGGCGVVPTGIEIGGDLGECGCLDATFRLKVNPKWLRAHIEHFTPVVISDGAAHRWSGRVIATPTMFGESDQEIVVQCQGWGQHLKDDAMEKLWVVDDLSRWRDGRSFAGITLGGAAYKVGAQVEVGDGLIFLGYPMNVAQLVGGLASVTLDLGPNNTARRAVITFESSNNTATESLGVHSRDTPNIFGGTGYGSASVYNNAGASGTIACTFTGGRYVQIYHQIGATYTPGADVWFKITSVKVFTDTADESGGASILKAATIVGETLTALCPLISSDHSKIAATSFNIPHFPAGPGWKYANEYIDAANAFHGYIARLSPDPVPVFEFQPVPTDYSYVVGVGEYTLQEPAAQDGREVFGTVVCEYEDAAGVRGFARVSNPSVTASDWHESPASRQPVNPSFTVDASGWTPQSGSTLSRTTGSFVSAPASGLFGGAGHSASTRISNLTIGRQYKASIWSKSTTAPATLVWLVKNVNRGGSAAYNGGTVGTTYVRSEIIFIADDTAVDIFILPSTQNYIDDLVISERAPNIIDARGFQRAALKPMDGPATAASALALAQLEYDDAQYPPFKGTIGITGRVRKKGGGTTHVSELVSRVGDAILIENLPDPNTGALGRQGIIRTAKYVEAANRTDITIDDPGGFVPQLRNRLSLASRNA